jgi:hypothetical protein
MGLERLENYKVMLKPRTWCYTKIIEVWISNVGNIFK